MAKAKAKKKAKVQAPPAKPVSAPKRKKEKAEPWAWIRGLVLSETDPEAERWVPLYNFRWPSQSIEARSVLRRLLEMPEVGRELQGFEDFDLLTPGEVAPEPPDEPLEAPQSDSEPLSAPEPRPKRQKAVQKPSAAPAKRKKRCREVYDANPKLRCIRRSKHEPPHRDLAGHEWDE